MQILPSSIRSIGAGLRPRLACEVRPGRIVAARSNDATGVISAIASSTLAAGALVPSLRSGNIVDRGNFIQALRDALDPLAGRAKDITLIVPDSTMRVLLLDFDTLPARESEALPVVRFRLKKLLPFEADDAGVSYQIMSQERNLVRVVAAAMPREVLDEYELAVRDAGYEPGAILPSTLASLTLLSDANTDQHTALLVNANPFAVTTAIVSGSVLLLHRTQDFTADVPALSEVRSEENAVAPAAEPAVPIFAANLSDAPPVVTPYVEPAQTWDLAHTQDEAESTPFDGDAYGGSAVEAEAAIQSEVLREEIAREALPDLSGQHTANDANESDVAQAVSIAAAYYEDTLNKPPTQILSAGMLDAQTLQQVLSHAEFEELMPNVREIVAASLLAADAASSTVPRCLLAGVAGALATGDVQS